MKCCDKGDNSCLNLIFGNFYISIVWLYIYMSSYWLWYCNYHKHELHWYLWVYSQDAINPKDYIILNPINKPSGVLSP